MDNGPAVSRIYGREEPAPGTGPIWRQYISAPSNYKVALTAKPETEELSRAEEALIEEIFSKYGNLSRWDLANLSHDLPEWQDPNGSALPIQYRDTLRAGNKTESEIAAVESELVALAIAEAMMQPTYMECGDTFVMPAPGGVTTPHLWIAITQPDAVSNLCAIVSVTTLRSRRDQTPIPRVGDHPFICHDSTIFYGDGMTVDARRLEHKIAAGLAVRQDKYPAATLKLIQQGVTASPSPDQSSCVSAKSSGDDKDSGANGRGARYLH